MANPFTRTAPISETADISREDVACYFEACGIDLDLFQQQALLANLPQMELSADVEIAHPNIAWRDGARTTRYLYRPTPTDIRDAIQTERDLVITCDKRDAPLEALANYQCIKYWESIGDLVLIWACDHNITNFVQHTVATSAADWLHFIDLISELYPDTSIYEKIIEDGYIHHLVSSETSPYLTQLETDS